MKKAYKWIFIALLASYVVLAFTLPTDPQVLARYDMSQGEARLLNITTVGPLVLIYLAALYGFLRIKDYAEKVRDSKEGPYFQKLATGLMILAFSLPINSIIGSLGSYIRHAQPHMLSEITIFRQYLGLILAFIAIFMIARGAEGLYRTLKRRSDTQEQTAGFYGLIVPIALASVYTWLIIAQAQSTSGSGPYYLPEWLVIITIAIPYIYTWCVGGWAAFNLYRYQTGVKGFIYKRAMHHLAAGIAAVILVSISLQFLVTLSGLINRLDLSPLLALVYVLIALYALGYGLVARGAKKLKQIEEV